MKKRLSLKQSKFAISQIRQAKKETNRLISLGYCMGLRVGERAGIKKGRVELAKELLSLMDFDLFTYTEILKRLEVLKVLIKSSTT